MHILSFTLAYLVLRLKIDVHLLLNLGECFDQISIALDNKAKGCDYLPVSPKSTVAE